MAENTYVNKVVYDNNTLIDLTEDTVTPETLISGYTAHDRSGASISGSAIIPTKLSELQNDVGFTTNTGTVIYVATGAGLTGGTITSSGTIKANLLSETRLNNDAVAATEVTGRVYPVALDNSGHLSVNVPWEDNDTKNTAGASDTSSKIYIIGALTQGANPQTYSQDTAYVGTDGCLYSNNNKVLNTGDVATLSEFKTYLGIS